MSRTLMSISLVATVAATGLAQSTHAHVNQPQSAGQAAFGAMSEIIAIMKADPATNWATANLEALRLHLIDMDNVVMNARIAQKNIPGGFEASITGTGTTAAAIQRMMLNHSRMLDVSAEYRARAEKIPGGARLTVTAKQPQDSVMVAMIRGLGVAGMMTEGNHHAPHHLALARGEPVHHP